MCKSRSVTLDRYSLAYTRDSDVAAHGTVAVDTEELGGMSGRIVGPSAPMKSSVSPFCICVVPSGVNIRHHDDRAVPVLPLMPDPTPRSGHATYFLGTAVEPIQCVDLSMFA